MKQMKNATQMPRTHTQTTYIRLCPLTLVRSASLKCRFVPLSGFPLSQAISAQLYQQFLTLQFHGIAENKDATAKFTASSQVLAIHLSIFFSLLAQVNSADKTLTSFTRSS